MLRSWTRWTPISIVIFGGSTGLDYMHALDGKLYFTGTDVANERELYVYVPDDLTT